jgi:phospholipase D1/2
MSAPSSARPTARAERAASVLQPGQTCWRVERASRVRLLQDAADYYAAVRQAVLQARHSVFVLGWDILAQLDLVPGAPDDGAPRRLADLLDFAVRRRRGLRCYVLVWDHSTLYALERDPFTRIKLGWLTHRRVHFRFDDHHPLGGSHHDKVVVVDDRIAFAGSIDLTAHRWDTSAHELDEPRRKSRFDQPYPPYHDVQLQVEGDVAAALGELARERWRRLGWRRLPRVANAGDVARGDTGEDGGEAAGDLHDVMVGIARTEPAFHRRAAVRECEALYHDSIAAARRWIYVENQYFTDRGVARALAARLREPGGPDVVVVGPRQCEGWLEKRTMGVLREGVLRELREADVNGRLRLLHPMASRERDVPTFVHSKLMIADGEFLRVGSANLARRSMGMDSECDLAVTAGGDARVRDGIAAMAHRLLAEHLGTTPDTVREAWARHGGLVATVDALSAGDRTLVETSCQDVDDEAPEAMRDLVDPDEPIGFVTQLGSALPELEAEHDRGRRVARLLPFGIVLLALLASWRIGPFGARTLADVEATLAAAPGSPLVLGGAVLAFVIAGLAFVPLQLLTVVAAVVLGGWRAAAAASLGALIAAAIGYRIGAATTAARLARWIGSRVYRFLRVLQRPGTVGIATLRLVPVVSATTLHLLAGVAGVPPRVYWLGNLLGLVPPIASACAVGALARWAWLERQPWAAVGAGLLAILLVAIALRLRATLLQQHVDRTLRGHDEQARFG